MKGVGIGLPKYVNFHVANSNLLSDIALAHARVTGIVTDPVGTLEAMASALIIVTVGTWVALLGLAFAILMPLAGGAAGVIRSVRGF